MKHGSISKLISGLILGIAIATSSFAQNSADKVDLSLIGNLVKNNAKGDYKFPGGFGFKRSGSRAYINYFAKKMASNDSEVKDYEDVLMQGIRVWEEQYGPKGYTNDLAGGLAFYTMVNAGLATNKPYEDNFLGNMVAQFRKAFCSKMITSMTAAKKQDMYDYMITESVYMQSLAAAGNERSQSNAAEEVSKFAGTQIKATFGVDASTMSFSATGVSFK
jgi:hypothetical protein